MADLREMNIPVITRDAAYLSVVEMSIGSAVHALHIPFVGHILSLNEGAFLCHASMHSASRVKAALACYEIAGVAASLKSFSPASKKLGPMLSLMMQGLLFAIGILLLGKRRAGQILGFIFLSTWAFLQPLLTLLVAMGPQQMQGVIKFYLNRFTADYAYAEHAIFLVIAVFFVLKITAGILIVLILNRADETTWWSWQEKWAGRSHAMLKKNNENFTTKINSPWKRAWAGLRSPLFLFSFILTWIFLFIQRESWAEFTWLALRPVGAAFIVLYLFHSPWVLHIFGAAASRVGILRPIHRRLMDVQIYLTKTNR